MDLSKPTDEPLSKAEREALLGEMSPVDWGRAESLARMAAFGLADMGPDDLLQQALTDLIGMVRTWRRDVPALVTLKVAMHSIASNARKKMKNGPIEHRVPVSTGEESIAEGVTQAVQARDELKPEDFLEARQELASIEELIRGDDKAELVLLAWMTGYAGSEAHAETGLDAKQFDAARQRLMRKLKAHAIARKTK